MATKAILFSFGCSEVNSPWLITSELANQRARKVLFTCVVYTNMYYPGPSFGAVSCTWDDEGGRYINQKHNYRNAFERLVTVLLFLSICFHRFKAFNPLTAILTCYS